jgi:cell division septal protein FtsQ
MKKKVKIKKKRRINFKRTFIFLLGIYLLGHLMFNFLRLPIKNIYVYDNTVLTDQEIIDMANISNYPSTFQNLSPKIEKKIKKNIYILDAKVYKKNFTEVHIKVEENRPLFFNRSLNKTILTDGKEVSKQFMVPTLINYVPDTKYSELINKMAEVDENILIRISEIQYNPNEVDDSRFLLMMNDGNYVYLTSSKFNNINSYIDIIKKFDNKKGILYLDYGNSFTILED